jgi:hypothetical protein
MENKMLEEYLDGKMSKDSYQHKKAQTAIAIQEMTEQLATLEVQRENATELMESHEPFFGQETLTRETLQALIKEIRVTSADELEIIWKFQDVYECLQEEGKVR